MQPNFLIVGASRSGTTTLYDWLRRHPQIFMPARKELRFFDRDDRFYQGKDFYERYFRKAKEGQIIGEASPPYFYKGITFDGQGHHRWNEVDDAPARIRSYYPDIKIIISLRNPIHRAYSQYWKNKSEGRETTDRFLDAVNEELQGARSPENSADCWLYKSRYSIHVAHWLSLFPRENFLFLVFDEWIGTPDKAASSIARFLDIPIWGGRSMPMKVLAQGRMPRSGAAFLGNLGRESKWKPARRLRKRIVGKRGYPVMDDEARTILMEHFQDDIRSLERLLQMDFSVWST